MKIIYTEHYFREIKILHYSEVLDYSIIRPLTKVKVPCHWRDIFIIKIKDYTIIYYHRNRFFKYFSFKYYIAYR